MNPISEEDPRVQPLLEWNQLARQNAEDAIVSSMFEAAFESSEPVEEFSTWLLVGTAAVASFALINAEKLAPFLGGPGFLVCGILLSLSSLLGMLSKVMAVQCKVQIRTSTAVRKTFAEHMSKHRTEEEKIEQGASA